MGIQRVGAAGASFVFIRKFTDNSAETRKHGGGRGDKQSQGGGIDLPMAWRLAIIFTVSTKEW
jgi:hypothetical protein